jgi:hypothetical protein
VLPFEVVRRVIVNFKNDEISKWLRGRPSAADHFVQHIGQDMQ